MILFTILYFPVTIYAQTTDTSKYRDLFTDTWVATDALGRKMPLTDDAGPVKNDHPRTVGIFYVTWHSDENAKLKSPYKADVSHVLSLDTNARSNASNPLWTEKAYHWGKPENGYFLSRDEYAIRKDMSMLSDAGVDVIIFDVTNAVRYWDEWESTMKVMERMRAEGNKVPDFCFWAFNGPVISVVQDLYEKIYKQQKYADLWFNWDGKPLILLNGTPLEADAGGAINKNKNPDYEPDAVTEKNNPHYNNRDYTEQFYTDYSEQVKSFFTIRNMWWGYHEWAGKGFVGTENNWSFGYDMGDQRVRNLAPQQLASLHNGKIEEMAVTPAQHPATLIGKSWSKANGEPPLNEYDLPKPTFVPWLNKKVEHPEGYGIYFQERWNDALSVAPPFIYINDWNEWTAGKYEPENGGTYNFMRRKNSFFFVDQYNAEFNRSIQPMSGGYTDNYYMQMAENIRRYKGVRPIPKTTGFTSIKIDGDFNDWQSVKTEYRDTKGDVAHRNYDGYGGMHYTDTLGRNDIVTSKVAIDKHNVYFYAETDKPLTSPAGKNWMLLFIDADKNSETGWFGYDYIINKQITGKGSKTLMRYIGKNKNGHWVKVADLKYRYRGKQLELEVPRYLLKLNAPSFSFDFHWCDNPVNLDDVITICVSGDSAPNRRFNYRYIWNETAVGAK